MRIAFLGDIALFGRCSTQDYFNEAAALLAEYDYVVGNLETPFSYKKRTYGAKSAYICSDPSQVKLLKQLHVNAVSLANNHMFDYGKEGYETTKQVLNANDIAWFGSEGKDHCITIENNHLAFLGFCCYSTTPLKCVRYGDYGVNEYDVQFVQEKAISYSEKGFLPVLSVHSGNEHVNYPSLDGINAAHLLADTVPLIYYGHHPHVVQGIEKKGDSLIAYSLGNFCFDDVYSSVSKSPLVPLSENNRCSCVLSVVIENSKLISWDIVPIYLGKDKLHVGKGVTPEIIGRYTDAIRQMAPEKYETMRTALLNDYYESRRKNRGMDWYIKRLRPRYFRIILNAIKNDRNYRRCVSDHLKSVTK